MKFSKVMGVALVLVALAVAVNALAFSTAAVTNEASFTISATKDAALAINTTTAPGKGFTMSVASGSGSLAINDTMQPNSVYTFSKVFSITHNAADTAPITLGSLTTDLPAAAGTIKLYEAGTKNEITNKLLATKGASVDVDLEVSVLDGAALGTQTFSIVVNATQN